MHSDTEQLNMFPGAYRSITVHVAGRNLQMTVETDAEEEVIREAERQVAERISMFGTRYRSINKQDLFSMVLMQFATESVDSKRDARLSDEAVANRLQEMADRIGEALV